MSTRRASPRLTERQVAALEGAVAVAGSQGALAKKLGCAQQTISKLVKGEIGVTVEMAVLFDREVGGTLNKHALRPDVFGSAPVETNEAAA